MSIVVLTVHVFSGQDQFVVAFATLRRPPVFDARAASKPRLASKTGSGLSQGGVRPKAWHCFAHTNSPEEPNLIVNEIIAKAGDCCIQSLRWIQHGGSGQFDMGDASLQNMRSFDDRQNRLMNDPRTPQVMRESLAKTQRDIESLVKLSGKMCKDNPGGFHIRICGSEGKSDPEDDKEREETVVWIWQKTSQPIDTNFGLFRPFGGSMLGGSADRGFGHVDVYGNVETFPTPEAGQPHTYNAGKP